MAKLNQPFSEMENLLKNLFKRYDQLEESLKTLVRDVFKIPVDAKDVAVDITVFGDSTRMNLVSFLRSVEKMSTAVVKEEFKDGIFQARMAKSSMNKMKSDVEEENGNKMLKEVQSVIELLRRHEANKQQVKEADVEEIIEHATKGADTIIKSFIVDLLKKIKEEIGSALDVSKLLKTSRDLQKSVTEVHKAITAVKESYDENLSALDKIISTLQGLLDEGKNEDVLRLLKVNAEQLLTTCKGKLSPMDPK